MDNEKQELGWERRILERLVLESVAEQKRRRRWGIFFKLLGFSYFGFLIWAMGDWGGSSHQSHEGDGYTAMIAINGVIDAESEAGAEPVVAALQSAYEDMSVRGVVLSINSPGGSPVQAGIINDEIYRLRETRPDLPIVAVVGDICASGGYYIAAAADKIYVNKASLVGSIGVLMDGFGFVGTMDKLGIERRLLTAGENKGFLDPFSPQRPEQQEYVRTMLADIHNQFIEVVRKGRGTRLSDSPEIFSGLVWTGRRSIELGLADEIGTVESVARDVFHAKDVRDFTTQRTFFERFAQRFGAEAANGAMGLLSRPKLQ